MFSDNTQNTVSGPTSDYNFQILTQVSIQYKTV